MYKKNDWKFNKEVSEVFDEHIKKSVPLYVDFHNDIVDISVYFSQNNTNIIDVGTSTGELINKLKEKNKHRNVTCIGIDIEESMIEQCYKKYGNSGINFCVSDALNYKFTNASVITCILILQFLGKEERKLLLKNIYNGLNKDGVLFVVEKVKTDILDVHDIYNDLYYDFKRNTLTDVEILDKNASLRGVMKPLTLDKNLEDIKEAGFKKFDIFMKYNNFVGILAIKGVNADE